LIARFICLNYINSCVEPITLPEEWCIQTVWSGSPVRRGHDPDSARSATKIIHIRKKHKRTRRKLKENAERVDHKNKRYIKRTKKWKTNVSVFT